MPWSGIGPYPGAFYKEHLACFSCRQMVRKPSPFLVRREDLKVSPSGLLCPVCKSPLHNMGKAFRPPLKSAIRQWRKIELQYRHGVRWDDGRW